MTCICRQINQHFGRALVVECGVCGAGLAEIRATIAEHINNPGLLRARQTHQEFTNRPPLKRGSKPLIGDKE